MLPASQVSPDLRMDLAGSAMASLSGPARMVRLTKAARPLGVWGLGSRVLGVGCRV